MWNLEHRQQTKKTKLIDTDKNLDWWLPEVRAGIWARGEQVKWINEIKIRKKKGGVEREQKKKKEKRIRS